jgi:hypothetical protein
MLEFLGTCALWALSILFFLALLTNTDEDEAWEKADLQRWRKPPRRKTRKARLPPQRRIAVALTPPPLRYVRAVCPARAEPLGSHWEVLQLSWIPPPIVSHGGESTRSLAYEDTLPAYTTAQALPRTWENRAAPSSLYLARRRRVAPHPGGAFPFYKAPSSLRRAIFFSLPRLYPPVFPSLRTTR